jgi:protoporphyrinogen oxidase
MIGARKTAIIIGGGPAGLTAALQLLRQSDILPIVFEAADGVGGIARTINFDGYRMDLGGHRFFSKSDWVMDWWQEILPLEATAAADSGPITISYHSKSQAIQRNLRDPAAGPRGEGVMLIRDRLSRIYFQRKFFGYPLALNLDTVRNLGPWRLTRAAASYARATLFPKRPEKSLEDFLINRFGAELYRVFFKAYTEKVWGVPCQQISAEWGAQRIKGLSLMHALIHALTPRGSTTDAASRRGQTSLIERFLYPELGPGQLWDKVAARIREGGGEIRLGHRVERLQRSGNRVTKVVARDVASNALVQLDPDYVISSMAVKDLVASLDPRPPPDVARVAASLPYRNFITVGLILKRMKPRAGADGQGKATIPPDNWIYIQEPDVRLGRLQIFNNWSPALVPDPTKISLGAEYFCNEDGLWSLSDAELKALAIRELEQLDLIEAKDVIAANVNRVPKAYPAYFGAYAEFATIRSHVDAIENLFLVGRNGMHRYNNQDHSMLTAKAAVDAIVSDRLDKDAIWGVNVDDEYHETAQSRGS